MPMPGEIQPAVLKHRLQPELLPSLICVWLHVFLPLNKMVPNEKADINFPAKINSVLRAKKYETDLPNLG